MGYLNGTHLYNSAAVCQPACLLERSNPAHPAPGPTPTPVGLLQSWFLPHEGAADRLKLMTLSQLGEVHPFPKQGSEALPESPRTGAQEARIINATYFSFRMA